MQTSKALKQFTNAGRGWVRRDMLLSSVALLVATSTIQTTAKVNVMKQVGRDVGSINPKAPQELSRFAFLVGQWRCDARLKSKDGPWQHFHVRWAGQYILDGYAIADEYTMTEPTGALVVLGMNFRTYDASKRAWHIKWLNGLSGTWTDLVSGDLGGISITDQAITYSFREPVAAQAYTKATYTNISKDHFTWLGESSNDGKSWAEFMVVECNRSRE